jgi:putative transposase
VEPRPRLSCTASQGAGLVADRPDELLKQLTKTVLETSLNEQRSGTPAYMRHMSCRAAGTIPNGTRSTTTLVTENAGAVEIDVSRDGARSPTDRAQTAATPHGADEVVFLLRAL